MQMKLAGKNWFFGWRSMDVRLPQEGHLRVFVCICAAQPDDEYKEKKHLAILLEKKFNVI